MNEARRCILIGSGPLSFRSIEDYDPKNDTVVAVDGGLSHCALLGIEPDLVIGDFDSLDADAEHILLNMEAEYPGKVLRLKPEKDDTDMLSALKWGLARGFTRFYIYAGLGGRLDHALANIQCLVYLRRQGAEGFLIDDNGLILVIENETRHFAPSAEGTLSLFSLERASVVSISHMKYPLDHYTVTNDYPIGISNEFIPGAAGAITVHSGLAVLILTRYRL